MSTSLLSPEPSPHVTACSVFSDAQQAAMAQPPASIRSREGLNGSLVRRLTREQAVASANHIFGLGGWDFICEVAPLLSENTVKQVLDRSRHAYKEAEILRVMYRARARVTVRGAAGQMVIREGNGVGVAECLLSEANPAHVHEAALQRAEGEALAAALESFGPVFGGSPAEPHAPLQGKPSPSSPSSEPHAPPEVEPPSNVIPLRAATPADAVPAMTVADFLAAHEGLREAAEMPPRSLFEPWASPAEATEWAKDLAEQVLVAASPAAVVALVAAHEDDIEGLARGHSRLAALLIQRATERLATFSD